MQVKYTRHALLESMPDEKISRQEVEGAIRKSEFTVKIAGNKYKFRYRDLEVVCIKTKRFWLVVTGYRIKQ